MIGWKILIDSRVKLRTTDVQFKSNETNIRRKKEIDKQVFEVYFLEFQCMKSSVRGDSVQARVRFCF